MIGRTVSHYKILDRLGQGGAGAVYLAEDLRTGRQSAIKFLSAGWALDADAKKRFIQEAGAAYALDHPGIGVVNEIDQIDDGQLFIAMRYYDGGTLQDRLDSGSLDCDEALDIVIQLGKGLAHAHQHGIVHRDLKPANVMFSSTGEAKIVDFGLALLAGEERLTATGATIGTPFYMSSEQAVGKETDARSDLFSLGIVLYELVAGERPFKGDYTAAVIHQIVYEEPESFAAGIGELPGGLAEVVARALQKDPQRRYQSAEEMVADLEAVRSGQDTIVLGREQLRKDRQPASAKAGGKRPKFAARPLFLWTLLAVVAILVAGVALDWGRGPSISPQDQALAVFDFMDLGTPEEQIESTGIMSLLNVGLLENSPVRVVSSEYLAELRHRLFDDASGPIEAEQALPLARESGATLLLVGKVSRIGENRFITWRLVDTNSGESLVAGRVESIDDPFLTANEIIATAMPAIASMSGVASVDQARSVEAVSTNSPEAFRHYIAAVEASNADRMRDAERDFEAAVRADSTFALAHLAMVVHYMVLDRPKSRAHLEIAWRWRDRLGHRDLLRLELFQELKQGNHEVVFEKYGELLERWPDDRTLLTDYSRILLSKAKYDRVYEVAQQGLRYYPDDLLFQLFACLGGHFGRVDEALAAARSLVVKHPLEPVAWDIMGIMFWSNAQPDSAEAAFARAIRLDPTFQDSQVNLAVSPYFRGDLDGAIDGFLALIDSEIVKPSWGPALQVMEHFGLASLYCEAGRYAEAEAVFRDPGLENLYWWQINHLEFLLVTMGRPEEVLSIELPREHNRTSLLCGHAYAAMDSVDAAQREYERVSGFWTKDGDTFPQQTRLLGAAIALKRGEPERARSLLAEARSAGVYFLGTKALWWREYEIRSFLLEGRHEEAVAELQELLRFYPGHAIAHYELGRVFQEQGDRKAALEEYTVFLEMWANADEGLPQLEDARVQVAELR